MPATGWAVVLLAITLGLAIAAVVSRSRKIALLAGGSLLLLLAYAGLLLLVISQM